MTQAIAAHLAHELDVRPQQVEAFIGLLDEGATVPFIARYRKEATGGLDDTQLRRLEERLGYLRELDDRRQTVLASIREQGKLTPDLERAIGAVLTKTELEDLYRPYKQKRRTKAQIAREQGLEPLARALLADPSVEPSAAATAYVREGVEDAAAALEGARQILMEEWADDPETVQVLRRDVQRRARVRSRLVKGKDEPKEEVRARFRDWFEFDEPAAAMPGHRALALMRGRKEGVLRLALCTLDGEGDLHTLAEDDGGTFAGRVIQRHGLAAQGRPGDAWLLDTARLCWKVKLSSHLETEVMVEVRERAEAEAIEVFAGNLRDLLLAAPAGPKVILGLDPGLRTGVKVAVVDRTGKVLDTAAVFPHAPRNDWQGALRVLGRLCQQHGVDLVSIGNGTASRETDRLAAELVRSLPDLSLQKLIVSEAGASVYSASELAAAEFPDLDVSLRGAVSIARRLQDPLAELVKIDPKSIGVGQYQHDVNQSRLGRSLEAVVEDCVNGVGVDVNTASAALLERVAGLNPTLAKNIVAWRDQNGPFRTRRQLLEVSRLGPKAFEQCAGFLRIADGDEPLDRSAVHPEAYAVAERIAAASNRAVADLIGDAAALRGLDPEQFIDDQFGLPTVTDILQELEKPGRDPRPEFVTAAFKEGVESIGDLEAGMVLEGVVSNVTNFGAFVDLGVHQDGLVHISQLADRFVEDPREVVKAGQVVKVRVLEVDLPRKRIALTMRKDGGGERRERQADSGSFPRGDRGRRPRPSRGEGRPASPKRPEPEVESPLAAQLRKLQQRRN